LRVPYLSLDEFVRSKRTGRPQDIADIQQVRGTKRR
jgi:hypothetical protein